MLTSHPPSLLLSLSLTLSLSSFLSVFSFYECEPNAGNYRKCTDEQVAVAN